MTTTANWILDTWPPDDERTLRCPFEAFAATRAHARVHRLPEPTPEGVPTFIVTGWAEAANVLLRADTFVNDLSGIRPDFGDASLPWTDPDSPSFYNKLNVFFATGEDHKVKRSWALDLVERNSLERYRPAIEAEVDRLIDAFADDGRCDFRAQFTNIMPMMIVRRAMGMPDDADPKVKRMSAAIAVVDNNPSITEQQAIELEESSTAMLKLATEVLRDRERAPRPDDHVSNVIRMQVQRDGAMDVGALAQHLVATLFGADHAMGGHLAQAVAHLAADRELQRRVRADRSLVRQVVLEALRIDATVPWLFRECTEDTTIAGVGVPGGSLVLVVTAAANRDSDEFPGPDVFDVDRDNLERNQLTLGRGSHRCAGAALARVLADVTINRMLDRFGEFGLDEDRSDLDPEPSFGFRIPKAVHLTFRRGSPCQG